MTRIATIAGIVWLEMLRRKDVYVLFILSTVILTTLVSLDVFGLGGLVRYVKDIGLLMAWVFGWVLAVTISSRELPREESRGTVFSLLAKPVSRFEVVTGKWLGAWTTVLAATLVFYALIAGVVLLKGGSFGVFTLAQGFVLHALVLAIVTATGILFSTRLTHDAAAALTYVLTGTSFLLLPKIPGYLASQAGVRSTLLLVLYHALPHFEVFDMRKRMVHDYGPLPPLPFTGIVLYGVLVVAVLLLLAWLAYRSKWFARGDL